MGQIVEDDSPNVDSLRRFLEEVWPRWPEGKKPSLTLVGRIAPALEEEFAAYGALVTGPVDVVRTYLNAVQVFLAPTRGLAPGVGACQAQVSGSASG